MSLKPTPQKISRIVHRYIKRYQSEQYDKKEYIYRLSPNECGEFGEFLRNDSGRAYICFYPLTPQQYNQTHDEFMSAQFYMPNYMSLKDNKLKLGLNVVIPTKNKIVETANVVEIIAHELNHAYTTWFEIQQKHNSHPVGIIATIADKFKSKKYKYTFSDRLKRYDNIIPNNTNDIHDDFRWVGYIGVRTEINAILAGIDAFLYEHNGNISKIKQSRGYKTINIVRKKFENLKQKASDADWIWAQKNATYIYNRKNEHLSQFKNRFIKYYNNVFFEFDKKIEKIINKYKKEKFINGSKKVIKKQENKYLETTKTR